MALPGQDFRGDIIRGSAHAFASLLLTGNAACQAEISEFLIVIPVYKQIWKFQITVDHIFWSKVDKSF